MANNSRDFIVDYIMLGPSIEDDKRECTKIIERICTEFKDIFSGMDFFKAPFTLQSKDRSEPDQVLLRHLTYALQQLFKEE